MSWKNEIVIRLSEIPIFAELSEESLLEIAGIVQYKVLPAHTTIFREGDPGDSFCIINSGKVKVFKTSEAGVETNLAQLGPKDSFGEMALLTGEPRSADVETLEETYLTIIAKEHFDRIIRDHPHLSVSFVRQLSSWLRSRDGSLQREAERQFLGPGFSWVDLFIILGLSVLFGIIFNLSNPNGISLLPKSWTSEPVPRVHPAIAMAKYQEGNTLFVDARPSNFFKQLHIKGAINLPSALFDVVYMLELSEIDRDKDIILYGRTISRLYDEEVCRKLILRGHKNAKIMGGGLSRWQRQGCPVEQ
ncbi:MAG: cyclic nucleotide-binding domain-containing protein [Deltaproteobacteria bacterium]|nr:MAG: cyclic nucleotide-binding domain-containing protein [Deltaproteobacteria bacterium]